jgi:putative ABC transport system permease protein
MHLLRNIASGLRSWLRRKQLDRELDDELAAYLEMAVEEKMKKGMSREEARRAVRIEQGTVEGVKEIVAAAGWESLAATLSQDLRFAVRTLRKSPGFASVAILTLGLGIGANTAIFQLLDAVRLRSLPVPNPQQLAAVRIAGGNHGMGLNQDYGDLTRPLWQEIRDNQRAFSGTFAWSTAQRYTGRGSEMRRFNALWVSGNFFQELGMRPFRGRLLAPNDEGPCPMAYGVASYSYWQRELGSRDPGEGIKLIVDNFEVEIVGVAPPEFFGMVVGDSFDIALPFCQPPEEMRRDIFEVSVMGRLKPGWTLDRASRELGALSPGIFQATVPPDRDTQTTEMYKHFRLAAYPASRGVNPLSERDYTSLWLLLGITGLVLVIACANLANLLLVRGSSRELEMAVRLAMGAARWRLVLQLLSEGALLAVTGATLGIAVAVVLSRGLVLLFSTENNVLQIDLTLDWRVLCFVGSVAMLTCIVFALAPALRTSRAQPSSALKSGSRGTTADRGRFHLQRLMIVTQVAISVMLLAGALLFVRSFRNLATLDPGMRERGITVAFLGYWQSNLPQERWADFQRELLEEVQAVPGVQSAATTTRVPLDGGSWEHGVRVGSQEGSSKFAWVSPDYFVTMGIPILRGRGFKKDDTAAGPRVAVVNQTFVRRFLSGIDPIGQTLLTISEPNYPASRYEITGIIPDTCYSNLRGETPPMTFAPATQFPAQGPWSSVVIYSSIPPATVTTAVKHNLGAKHPDVIMEFHDFRKQILDSLVMERVMATLSGFFGLLAAVLAAIGIYGVLSYIIALRRNEIGVRMVLGASRIGVLSLVLRQTALLLAGGVGIGMVLALALAHGAGSLLFGLRADDPATIVGAGALLIAVALLACYLPARRAMRIDPMVALRYE